MHVLTQNRHARLLIAVIFAALLALVAVGTMVQATSGTYSTVNAGGGTPRNGGGSPHG